ncbi:MAG: nicotinate-nucleotide adenylyltransferase [Saprospiraceae bacterium]|jgi:nicotinate-nucleotide adenylyltransferase|uniref:nicotinate (nicotinamide) nucleotide adenylyltransferase n=1 Tax=Candidatus Brachybacter algidus TaxID=2982024 RepID=UPI001B6631BB|nr:nicotinate (nicotinamide) nucleotide adenylyltransferase [Candidatus Brachybacter algidus]MBP7305352.1 nicotinate-nucleotide adenylyltransferase [Saprospiraceae bacterium]MBK6447501.1 nicotinate-nucleotide adenylyltransferase [Candidatus Brachybacter algidus]MBK7603337.1 nicotinate-nucleotide adenylyltransferase [Candidatus Brachybacter algidus]MBK8356743.1 nicotinate-nucleotide adenylyltransferase [Candidatus Brachybacter algidus]MBK8603712.1 nicotinate-nucleotide adenylyltransferase [Cand
MNKHIGLFFGSFNPVHIGHLIIANHMANETDLDQVWMVVSPQNPFKDKKSLAKDRDRYNLVHLAIGDNPKLSVSDIEFSMPKPSYTIDTLTYLKEKYPNKIFYLIMGGDNVPTLPKWKNSELLIENYKIYVYKRPGYDLGPLASHPNITSVEAPLLDISSTHIRQLIKERKSIQYLMPDAARLEIERSSIYSDL